MMNNFEIFKSLCDASGVSSGELRVSAILKKELTKILAFAEIDKMGNLTGKNRKEADILLVAHMDEIGLMAKNISDTGFIEFEKMGGIIDHYLPAQRVVVHGKKDIRGVIALKIDPELTREKLKEKVLKQSDLYIDTGLSKKELSALEVFPGTLISFDQQLQNENGILFGKAFDDRAGCFVALEVLRRVGKKANLSVLFTTQEEVGLKGAQTAIHSLNPKLAIEIEITSTSDIPNMWGKPIPISIGKGPVVTIADGAEGLTRGFIAPQWLVKKIQKIRNPDKLQWRIAVGGTSDASVVQLEKKGIPTISFAVPMRYPHTAVGLVKMSDIEATIDFVEEVILVLTKDGTLKNI